MPLTKVTNSMIVGAAINPQDYGGDNTGVNESHAALTAAAADSASSGFPLYLNGTYKIRATLNLSAVNVVHSDNCVIIPTFDTGSAVQYSAPQGDFIENMKLLGNLTVEWPTQDWTKERTSFYLSNVYNGEFNVSSRKATRGLVCLGNDKGVVHNDFYLGDFFNNSVGVWLDAVDATGWCNMNRFHGGYFYGDGNPTGSLYAAQAGHIYTVSSPYAVNGNVFLYPSLEWGNTTGGFRMARLGGTRNKLLIGYTEVNAGDTTWFVISGLKNLVNCQFVPYAIGYDPTVSGANNRIDASTAQEPWIVGTQGYLDSSGEGSQIYKNNSSVRPTMWLKNAGGKALRLQNASSSSEPALEIVNTNGSAGVEIPATGVWTVFNGSIKVLWNQVVAPTTGTWNRGDIAWNVQPSAGGTPGWMCVASGTPGTWKAMANLAP